MLKEIDSHQIEITNQDKILFPRDGITKLDLVEYYEKIFECMIPHIQERAITMHRFPDGIEKDGFFHKQKSDYFPEWIETVSAKKEDGSVDHVICDNKATLVYLANQACITPHIWLSRKRALNFPDKLIFDLDPPSKDFEIVRDAAKKIRLFFDNIGITTFVMTTGSTGIHIVIPLDSKSSFDQVRNVSKSIADIIERENSDIITTAQRKERRGKRLYLDVLRNSYGQTSVAPYSLRAKKGAPIATPIEWNELEKDNISSQYYNIKNIFRRMSQKKDPWQDIYRQPFSILEIKKMIESY